MTNLFKSFRDNEDGAITVDWVVLTAAIVGIGLAVTIFVGGGATSTADAISSRLASQTL